MNAPVPPSAAVLSSEVGPRDGLQRVKATMPTAAKPRWIDALCANGLREIEVCSFVPARLLPHRADAAAVVAHALTLPLYNTRRLGLANCLAAFGVNIELLLAAPEPLMAGLPGEPIYGTTPEAGLPKGYVQEAVSV